MSEDREKALLLALKAVMNLARKQGLNLDDYQRRPPMSF